MVTKCDDDDNQRRQGEYRAICLWKMGWQSFAIFGDDKIALVGSYIDNVDMSI